MVSNAATAPLERLQYSGDGHADSEADMDASMKQWPTPIEGPLFTMAMLQDTMCGRPEVFDSPLAIRASDLPVLDCQRPEAWLFRNILTRSISSLHREGILLRAFGVPERFIYVKAIVYEELAHTDIVTAGTIVKDLIAFHMEKIEDQPLQTTIEDAGGPHETKDPGPSSTLSTKSNVSTEDQPSLSTIDDACEAHETEHFGPSDARSTKSEDKLKAKQATKSIKQQRKQPLKWFKEAIVKGRCSSIKEYSETDSLAAKAFTARLHRQGIEIAKADELALAFLQGMEPIRKSIRSGELGKEDLTMEFFRCRALELAHHPRAESDRARHMQRGGHCFS